MGRYTVLVVNNFLFSTVIGSALGFLAGLGVGGGSLLMLWLTAVIGMEYPQARTINLLFFLPCAFISTLFRWKQGTIELRSVIPAIVTGCICAVLGTWLGNRIHLELLKKLFGALLLFTGVRELFYRPRKAK